MIRAGLPLPPALRLRIKADAAAEGLAKRVQLVRRRFVAVVRNNPVETQTVTPKIDREDAQFMRNLEEFIDRYDDLVDLLCWTAKEGVNDVRRARYTSVRTWFLTHFDEVRPAVIRHLEVDPDDSLPVSPGTPRPRDAFEALFLPPQIDSLISADGVITRIVRTRNAVEACREELERACVLAG